MAGKRGKGFCVICEREENFIKAHAANIHDCLESDPDEKRCYNLYCFDGIRIMAPHGVKLRDELEKCSTCHGVFFKQRVTNHQCTKRREIHSTPHQECEDDFDEGTYLDKMNLGFCVICEKEERSIFIHQKYHHKRDKLGKFKRRRVVVCETTNLETDLSKCKLCNGVFLKKRFPQHACKFVYETDEGTGKEYCLMCQWRCESVDDHLKEAHGRNESVYAIHAIQGINTLLPKKTKIVGDDLDILLVPSPPCGFHCCLSLTYKNRLKRTCLRKVIDLDNE